MKVVEPAGPFVLRVHELEQGENRLERVGSGADLALDPSYIRLAGPVVLRAVVYRAGDHVDVQGTVTASVDLACDRCLAPLPEGPAGRGPGLRRAAGTPGPPARWRKFVKMTSGLSIMTDVSWT